MRISEILKISTVKVGLESREKTALFEEMLQLFVNARLVRDSGLALQALLQREAKVSTGISRGLALPHGRIKGIRGVVLALGISRVGIDYGALDGHPVHVVLMALTEAGNPGPHIEALAEVSRLVSVTGFTQRLREARGAHEILATIRHEE